MICVIRIHGRVKMKKDIVNSLDRLRLRKKYSCIVINPTKEQEAMIKKLRDFVAFGEINTETFEKLIEKRGQFLTKNREGQIIDKKKIDSKNIVDELEKGKKYESLNLKPFFRLHPPRKGIKAKLHFPKGVLGYNGEKINDLVGRML